MQNSNHLANSSASRGSRPAHLMVTWAHFAGKRTIRDDDTAPENYLNSLAESQSF